MLTTVATAERAALFVRSGFHASKTKPRVLSLVGPWDEKKPRLRSKKLDFFFPVRVGPSY